MQVGTDADDKFVFTAGEIFGAGLTISFANIEKLEVKGEAGNRPCNVSSGCLIVFLSYLASLLLLKMLNS